MESTLTREQALEQQAVFYATRGNLDALLDLYDNEDDLILKGKLEGYINENAYKIAVVADVLPPRNIIDVARLHQLRDMKYFYNAIREFNFANVQNLFSQTQDKVIDIEYLEELLNLLNYDSGSIRSVSHVAIYFSVLVLYKEQLEDAYIWQGQIENMQAIIKNPVSYAGSYTISPGKVSRAKIVQKSVQDFFATVADFAAELSDEDYLTFIRNLRSLDKEFSAEIKKMAGTKREEDRLRKKTEEKERKTSTDSEEETEEGDDINMEREENED